MQIVIKLPKKRYEQLKEIENGSLACGELLEAIVNGTPLPKGHGRLIDETSLIINLFEYSKGNKTIGQCIDSTPTTIRADIGGGEDDGI